MELKQVLQTCLDFSIANSGTIQPLGNRNKFAVQSRTTRTEILIDQIQPSVWQAEQTQNAVGGKRGRRAEEEDTTTTTTTEIGEKRMRRLDSEEEEDTTEIVSTEAQLLDYLSRFWDKENEGSSSKAFARGSKKTARHYHHVSGSECDG